MVWPFENGSFVSQASGPLKGQGFNYIFFFACSIDVKTCNEVDLENSIDWEVKTITSALKQYLR